jgi:glycosyltransferase involved in cell wall biosynthesis
MSRGAAAGRPGRVLYVLTWYTAQSTFIVREVEALRRIGMDVVVLSIRRPEDSVLASAARVITTGIATPRNAAAVISETARSPLESARVLGEALHACRRSPRAAARALAGFWVGCRVAREARRESSPLIHAHWATVSASAAWFAGRLAGTPFSFTGHAWDLFVPDPMRALKVRDAARIVTCTAFTRHRLEREHPTASERMVTVYHGVELPEPREGAGAGEGGAPLILAVGRLVEKKGFADLVAACRDLAGRGVRFKLRIVGPDGGEGPRLRRLIGGCGLADRVALDGAMTQADLGRLYAAARVLVAPSIEDRAGIMDGIPNVILEAMANGVPVVASAISGIPEAVEDGVTGFLVPPGDPGALADKIARVLADESGARRMGAAGRRLVAERFDPARNAARLASILAPAGVPAPCRDDHGHAPPFHGGAGERNPA